MCTRPYLCQYCAHNTTNDWGLVVHAVVLTVPKIWVNFWSGGTLFKGGEVPVAAALSQMKMQTNGVQNPMGAANIELTRWHLFWYAEMRGRNVCSKRFVRSYCNLDIDRRSQENITS
jgi:hypothetical protein